RKEEIGDFIIQRSDGTPTYNFAVAVDDALMEITHVIRGEDHLSNTPKQIMIYKALGFDLPQFAHLPMIFGFDKKPLSKRHGATSVSEYKDKGYFAEALLNYLALLGWSLDDKTTIISKDELIAKFNLNKVSKNPAVWDIKKLEWMNGYYMRDKSLGELIKLAVPLFEEKGYKLELDKEEFYNWLKSCFSIIRERAKTLKEIPELIEFLLSKEISIDDNDWDKLFKEKDLSEQIMKLAIKKVDNLQEWTVGAIEKALREIVKETGYKVRDVFQRIRLALTGKLVSPPLFESIKLAGKELTVKRLKNALVKIRGEN
ncbi:MAG: glutamate--tRNA ligase, partial [Actinomycetia bacterium]|nr:glutamate--tRNA ligase [Actinomycetes bacterium]